MRARHSSELGQQPGTGLGLFSGTNNCWYARAGDTTPVSVTVDGNPATVTPNPTRPRSTNVGLDERLGRWRRSRDHRCPPPSRRTSPETWLPEPDIPSGTTVTGQGNGTTGDYATVELTLSNDATATLSGIAHIHQQRRRERGRLQRRALLQLDNHVR